MGNPVDSGVKLIQTMLSQLALYALYKTLNASKTFLKPLRTTFQTLDSSALHSYLSL
jgi:hypothetical protein